MRTDKDLLGVGVGVDSPFQLAAECNGAAALLETHEGLTPNAILLRKCAVALDEMRYRLEAALKATPV